MLEIIKTGSSMIPVPMVQPLIGVVAGFLQAADVSCALISLCEMLMTLLILSKPVIILNGWGGFLSPRRSVWLALPCVVQSRRRRRRRLKRWRRWSKPSRLSGLRRSTLFKGKSPTVRLESQTFRTFLYRKLSDIVQRAEDFCQRSVVSRFLQQGCDKGAVATMKEDLKAAINNFNVRPFH